MAAATEQKRDLTDFAQSIVRGQTNVYVKELLREHGVRIGATKHDFDRNLVEAIEAGVITGEHLQLWLNRVEGWGQQQAYVYRLTAEQRRAFSTEARAHQKIREARLSKYWRESTAKAGGVKFPEDEQLQLVSITYADSLLFQWHKGTKYWGRTKREEKHDKRNEWIEGFEYEFRAFRGRSMREVMRFEIRSSAGLAALFIPKPVSSKAHVDAYAQAQATLGKVLDFSKLEARPFRTSRIIRNLDQKLAFNGGAGADVRPQSTQLKSGVAYVEFAAVSKDHSYSDSTGVRRLRESLRSVDDIKDFSGTAGTFRFDGLGRVQLFAEDNRIKLWSSLTADGVWHILNTLASYQDAP